VSAYITFYRFLYQWRRCLNETLYAARKLVRILPKMDERAQARIYGYADVLPPAAFFTVRSQLAIDRKKGRGRQIRDEVAYALGALSAMCSEQQYVGGGVTVFPQPQKEQR
jgi:hypothetical protein